MEKAINTSSLDFSTDALKAYYKVSGTDSLLVNFRLTISDGKYINKRFTFYGNNITSEVILSFLE